MNKRYFILTLFLGLFMAVGLNARAQETRTVSGTVISATDNQPIAGASVIVTGTSRGVATGADGTFSLSAPSDASLTVSFVGYETRIVTDLSQTRIVLVEDAFEMETVVAVGYGTQKLEHLTGSVSVINPDEIKDFATGDLTSALQGMVPGLNVSGGLTRPGTTATLSIRQAEQARSLTTSYDTDENPLYIIDDFEATVDQFNNLNPNEIETISVLKDASAAVYGVRAAQGVIVVRTKRGHIGAPKISYQGQFGFTDRVKKTKMLSAYDYGTIYNATRAAENSDNTEMDRARDLFQYEELQAMRNLNYDLLEDEWSLGVTQRHSVNISGGTERARYFGSISYFTQDGNIGNLDYDRWNYRAGMDTKIGNWFNATLQVSGTYADQTKALNKVGGSNDETDYNVLLTNPRYIPSSVNGLPLLRYGVTNSGLNDVQKYNYEAAQSTSNYINDMTTNMQIGVSLEHDFGWVRPLRGLKMSVRYSKSIDTKKGNEVSTDYTLYRLGNTARGSAGLGSDFGHLYTGDDVNYNDVEAVVIKSGSNGGDGNSYLSREMIRTDRYQLNFITSYARDFGLHSVSGLFTIEKAENETENVKGKVLDPYSFHDGQSGSATGTQETQFGRSAGGILSYAGRLNYSYDNKYLFEFLIRADASTVFAPENYWGVFPSVSAGWIMSREDWFNSKGIDFLKIRGSFGLTGKDNIDAWGWLQTYGMNSHYGAVFGTSPSGLKGAGISMSQAPNRDAHWDKSYKTNIGVDLRTLNNRLSVTLDMYYDMGRELFAQRSGSGLPTTVGSPITPDNYAEMDLYGVELSVGWKDRIGTDFSYFVNVNTDWNDNKVKKSYFQNGLDKVKKNGRTDTGRWGYECLGMFRSYQEIAEYFEQNEITSYLGRGIGDMHPGMLIYRDIRGPLAESTGEYEPKDGKITSDDMIRISKRKSNPYGLSINFGGAWKGLSFRAQIAASWGTYSMMGNTMRSTRPLVGSSNSANQWKSLEYTNLPSYWAGNVFNYNDVTDANGNIVAAANRSAKYPSLRYYDINSNDSNFWTVSGTRITLRNVTLAYALPDKIISKVGIASCRINVTAQNVCNLYNPYPDNFIDPMSTYGNYPTLRQINVGVNVSF